MGLILSLNNSIQSFNRAGFVGLLDQYTGAAAGYSLRRLSVNSTNVVRVRRSVDNAEADFTADEITDGTLTSFVGGQNLCLQSEDINTTWIPVNATPTQSTEETPDGDTTNKYIKLIDDSGGGTGVVAVVQNITVLANTKYTASVFAKADQLNFFTIQALGIDGATNARQYFNLSTGAKGAPENLDDSQIVAYPNGWYRCSITWTQGAADTSFQLSIALASSISSITVDRDGTSSVFVWGAQVNEGATAGDYVPTTSNVSGYGYVTTWYDQSGNSNDATQATASSQPKIVDAGVLVEENGKPAVDFLTSSSTFLDTSTFSLISQPTTTFAVVRDKSTSNPYRVIHAGTTANKLDFGMNDNDNLYGYSTSLGASSVNIDNQQASVFFLANGASSKFAKNGLSTETKNIGSALTQVESLRIGEAQALNADWEGVMQEIIFYPSDQSSNRTNIETNINNHYNIYP